MSVRLWSIDVCGDVVVVCGDAPTAPIVDIVVIVVVCSIVGWLVGLLVCLLDWLLDCFPVCFCLFFLFLLVCLTLFGFVYLFDCC